MDGLKNYTISWLEWGADYLRDDPQDFFSKCEYIRTLLNGAHLECDASHFSVTQAYICCVFIL